MAAVLLACLESRPNLFTGREKEEETRKPDKPQAEREVVDFFTANWLKKLELAAVPVSPNTYPPTVKQRLLYLLDLKRKPDGNELVVAPATGNIKIDGSFGSWRGYDPINAQKSSPAKFLLPADISILTRLAVMRNSFGYYYGKDYALSGKDGRLLLEEMLATRRCYWKEPKGNPLSLGEERRGKIIWEMADDGSQRIGCEIEGGANEFLPLSPPFYVDTSHNCSGILNTGLPDEIAGTLLQTPPVKPLEVEAVCRKLSPHLTQTALPKLFEKTWAKESNPVPHLHLTVDVLQDRYYSYRSDYTGKLGFPAAALSFVYGTGKIAYGDEKIGDQFAVINGNEMVYWKRNRPFENETLNLLRGHGFVPIKRVYDDFIIPQKSAFDLIMGDRHGQRVHDPEIIDHWMEFVLHTLPKLRKDGWLVEIDPEFPYNVVRPDDGGTRRLTNPAETTGSACRWG